MGFDPGGALAGAVIGGAVGAIVWLVAKGIGFAWRRLRGDEKDKLD
jgi:hypothetical protein